MVLYALYSNLTYVSCIFASGGVLTPGAAFAETTLIERLDKAGVRFLTVEEPNAIANE